MDFSKCNYLVNLSMSMGTAIPSKRNEQYCGKHAVKWYDWGPTKSHPWPIRSLNLLALCQEHTGDYANSKWNEINWDEVVIMEILLT